ncbi:Zn-dependent hydrolase [Sphingomonas sp. BIUV-7]|uniref:Zn-dependent hydrolase n=1 Tax=Sphingomonas natans TaxID=3063330 RepID=A0ABT8Y8A0_9SPHN|nr:Zn-dependent hydrolase [Sphingomonas sp. BIUV-7]MDO6413954.1 Zn-dependent hydrolase [Sphingomonas sp. BIUV-7]
MVSAPIPGGARAKARCDALGVAPYSDSDTGLFRAYLTPAHAAAQEAIGAWMVGAGMVVRLDQAANLIGRYEGSQADAPVLLFGSHIDSVRDAGRYDGPLGVMLGIEVVARLNEAKRRLPFPIEVIAFGDEEGSRFPASMLTSRAVAGTLEADALEVADRDGVTLLDALAAFPARHAELVSASMARPLDVPAGGEDGSWTLKRVQGDGFLRAARTSGSVLAYVEPHIEQGPVLEAEGLAVGTVTGIAAQLRYQVTVSGTAGHAGTTAMGLRRDALTAAAAMILAVESEALAAGGDVVATVGRMAVGPGAVNVIPGKVEYSIDVRSGDPAARDDAAAQIVDTIADIAERRDVEFNIERVQDLPAAPCDPKLIALMDAAIARCGQRPRRLVSGAGHDTMVMAALAPTAMLFIRCAGGVSHNPAESVTDADCAIALDVLTAFVDLLEHDVLA